MTISRERQIILSVFFLFLISFTKEDPVRKEVHGTISGGSIFYQTRDFFNISNVINPVEVTITSMANSSALYFCYNYLQGIYPISGTVVDGVMTNCPQGAFGTLNPPPAAEMGSHNMKLSRTRASKLNKLRQTLADLDTTNSTYIYLTPSIDLGGVVVAPQDSTLTTDFTIVFNYDECPSGEFPVGTDQACSTDITTINPPTETILSVPANSTSYYVLTIESFISTTNNAVVIQLGSSSVSTLYVQQGYIPTPDWFIASANPGEQIEIYTPSYFDTASSQTYYIAVANPTSSVDTSSLNVSFSPCTNSSSFGFNCQVSEQSSSQPINQVTPISAVLTLNSQQQTETTNNGTAWAFSDYSSSDYNGQFLFFLLTNLPNYTAVRVSVGANDHDNSAPNIYAKRNGYPSSLSYDYMVMGISVSSQLVLPIISQSDQWFIAVQLPSDFSIWVGGNCANNCSNEDHGACSCSTSTNTVENCVNLIAGDGSQVENLYIFPTNIADSAGTCTCDDDLFGGFECTDVLSYTPVIVVFVVTIVTAIILVVLIAVPSYFYLQRKKRNLYEQL